jgi:hypothetical protein
LVGGREKLLGIKCLYVRRGRKKRVPTPADGEVYQLLVKVRYPTHSREVHNVMSPLWRQQSRFSSRMEGPQRWDP